MTKGLRPAAASNVLRRAGDGGNGYWKELTEFMFGRESHVVLPEKKGTKEEEEGILMKEGVEEGKKKVEGEGKKKVEGEALPSFTSDLIVAAGVIDTPLLVGGASLLEKKGIEQASEDFQKSFIGTDAKETNDTTKVNE